MNSLAKTYRLDVIEEKAVWASFAMIVLLVISYLYLVNSSVFNIMARREAEEKISSLGTQVALLESQYIELSSRIDMDLARQFGFREIEDTETKFTAKVTAPINVSFASAAVTN
ncbi:MAG TPA: hypothetical protein VEB60_00085 [Candidatus Paceibacterota bacterium]|nr:hypothetical protein [Candidatus Paceibacterota bacterium]